MNRTYFPKEEYSSPSVELIDMTRPLGILAGFSGDSDVFDFEDDGELELYNNNVRTA